MAGAAIPDVYAPPMPATTLGNMVETFLQKILDITVAVIARGKKVLDGERPITEAMFMCLRAYADVR